MYTEKDKVYYSEDDQCNKCLNKLMCPLVTVLALGLIEIIPEDLAVEACPMYNERKLRIIKEK